MQRRRKYKEDFEYAQIILSPVWTWKLESQVSQAACVQFLKCWEFTASIAVVNTIAIVVKSNWRKRGQKKSLALTNISTMSVLVVHSASLHSENWTLEKMRRESGRFVFSPAFQTKIKHPRFSGKVKRMISVEGEPQ